MTATATSVKSAAWSLPDRPEFGTPRPQAVRRGAGGGAGDLLGDTVAVPVSAGHAAGVFHKFVCLIVEPAGFLAAPVVHILQIVSWLDSLSEGSSRKIGLRR
jgi:hypothetical protein